MVNRMITTAQGYTKNSFPVGPRILLKISSEGSEASRFTGSSKKGNTGSGAQELMPFQY
jgi:hypothetical protein